MLVSIIHIRGLGMVLSQNVMDPKNVSMSCMSIS